MSELSNKVISRNLRLLSQLMELHDENSFKTKAVANAAFKVDKLPYPIASKTLDEIALIEGLGKSTASRIWSLITSGQISEMDELLGKTPPGIAEMMQIKGLGPKKIKVIWQELGIENVGELYYACNENRLIEIKGFGLKTQQEIIKAIEFRMASTGRFLYAKIEEFADQLIDRLHESLSRSPSCVHAGQFRRKCEVIDSLEIIIVGKMDTSSVTSIIAAGLEPGETHGDRISCSSEIGIDVHLNFCTAEEFGWELIEKTGSEGHVAALQKLLSDKPLTGLTEVQIYELARLPFIQPELRENTNEFELAKNLALPELIKYSDILGALHNHSTWSDGANTIEEMAVFCRDELNLQYFGISDHSKSAFYANGLNEIRIAAQHREVDDLNKKLAPFHIFKGIESDILYDGSLDYSDEVLSTFDFVVASIHTTFKMSEEKATERLIKAIENPYTTILGHPTGRLLLSRNGYPINHKKIIDACSANGVIIEINSNPLRLDIDWRWHQYALERGVMLSINPDAHRTSGFRDMYYGTLMARKGGVTASQCLNALNVEAVKAIFTNKKAKAVEI